jgi:hypothetical protein
MYGFAARDPDHHHHSAGKESDRLKTLLAVIGPSVLDREHRTGQHDLCVKEIELPVMQVLRALDGVERDHHPQIIAYTIIIGKSMLYIQKIEQSPISRERNNVIA